MKYYFLIFTIILLFLVGCFTPYQFTPIETSVNYEYISNIKEVEATLILGKTTLKEAINMLGEPTKINSGIYGSSKKYSFDQLFYDPYKNSTIYILNIYTPSGLNRVERFNPDKYRLINLSFTDGTLSGIYN